MHPRQPIPDSVTRLAGLQAGVVTREQTIGCGLSRHAIGRLLNEGRWVRIASGLYLTTAAEPSWRALAWAGVLAGGDRARLGGTAAGYAWGLCAEPPAEICVLVPNAETPPRLPGPWHFVRERAGVRDARSVGDPPRVQLEDVAVDLASAAGPEQVVTWLAAAVQTRRTTSARLAAVVAAGLASVTGH